MRKTLTLLLSLLMIFNLTVSAFGAEKPDTPKAAAPAEEPLDAKMEAALAWALEIAADDSHGYSQSERFGPNYDCASFVCTALMEGGFSLEDCLSPAGLVALLPELGFTVYRRGETEPRRGDILVRTGVHVEFCMGNGGCLAAHRNYDRRSGDSGGHEIEYRLGDGESCCPFCEQQQYNYILRYEGAEIRLQPLELEINLNSTALN